MTAGRAGLRGFTLIEVVVTFLIIGFMAAVTVPAILGDAELNDLDTAVQRVETLLRMARDSAVSTAVPVHVVVDSASSLVWLSTGPRAGSGIFTPGALPSPIGLPAGIRMQSTSARTEFVFQPGGFAFPDSLLLSSGTESRLVTLDPMTGHVLVYR